MKTTLILHVVLFVFLMPVVLYAETKDSEKARVIVTTDLGGADPDDIQSMIHLLLCSDMVDMEGIVSSQTWIELPDNSQLIKKYIDEYSAVYECLSVRSSGYPEPEYLKSVTVFGQSKCHMDGVGDGKDSDGSELIIKSVDKKGDSRPLWVLAWGGTNTVAQALWKVSKTRSPREVRRFVSKLRVYDILGQDDAGAWIAKTFPDLIYIRNTEVYGWAPSDEWTDSNIQSKGSLGSAYPDRIWATEGDSPSFLYLIANGLNVPEHPEYGGWGGRFNMEPRAGIRGMSFIGRSGKDESRYDPYYMIGSAPEGVDAIRMWMADIWNDFSARMFWTQTNDYSKANHHPSAFVGKDGTKRVLYKNVRAGRIVMFDASSSIDPDGDMLDFRWSVYAGSGTYDGNVRLVGEESPICSVIIPRDASGRTIHLVLELRDEGSPSLASYRRIVINVK
jgi:hypothetical protein